MRLIKCHLPFAMNLKSWATSIVLTAGAALADAERSTIKRRLRRKNAEQEFKLAAEFCRLLLEPVSSGHFRLRRNYRRKHISVAPPLTQALATHNPSSVEYKRLARIAGLIGRKPQSKSRRRIRRFRWFGDDDDTVVRELEKHSFG